MKAAGFEVEEARQSSLLAPFPGMPISVVASSPKFTTHVNCGERVADREGVCCMSLVLAAELAPYAPGGNILTPADIIVVIVEVALTD